MLTRGNREALEAELETARKVLKVNEEKLKTVGHDNNRIYIITSFLVFAIFGLYALYVIVFNKKFHL